MTEDIFLKEDIESVLGSSGLPWNSLKNKTIVVTGATGFIGSLICRTLMEASVKNDLDIHVVALVRDIDKAERIYGKDCQISFCVQDICEPIQISEAVDYIIHCASVTSSATMVNDPAGTIAVAINGTRNTLELAKDKTVEAYLYLSSMEVYGSFDNMDRDVNESDMGYVDPLAVRSNYPLSKRLCENMCIAYMREYNVPVKIARLAQTFGPGILPGENRVFAQFARNVIQGTDIVLHTKGLSEGNYCYSADALTGIFTILLKGETGEAYNVSNPDAHTTIAGMAEMVCDKIADNKIKVVYDIPKDNIYGYAADTKMRLSADKLMRLGWKPLTGLEQAFRRLIGSMSIDK